MRALARPLAEDADLQAVTPATPGCSGVDLQGFFVLSFSWAADSNCLSSLLDLQHHVLVCPVVFMDKGSQALTVNVHTVGVGTAHACG